MLNLMRAGTQTHTRHLTHTHTRTQCDHTCTHSARWPYSDQSREEGVVIVWFNYIHNTLR